MLNIDLMNSKLNSIAVISTCYNRKNKTITCLKHLYKSYYASSYHFRMDVYLTDDGSKDGTSAMVSKLFPDIHILYGNGNLYWAGGMRNSWEKALKSDYDAYLLLNDDTTMEANCFDELFKTHEYSFKQFGMGAIYIGSTRDPQTLEHTYGGSLIINKWTFHTQKIIPNGKIIECHIGCANIMFVYSKVVDELGILCNKYIHAKADYDYTLRAHKKKIPILVCSNYCGYCTRDRTLPNFAKMNFKERIQYLKSPKGIEFSGYMYFMWKFFPFRAPFVYCSLWLKTLIPFSFNIINSIMHRHSLD